MRALLAWMGDRVAARPVRVIVLTVFVTVALGALSGQARSLDQSQSAYAPQSDEIVALNELQDRFGDEQTLVLQVLVTTRQGLDDQAEAGPIVTPSGLADTRAVVRTAREHFGDRILDTPQRPGVVAWSLPIEQAAQAGGLDLDEAGPDQLVVLYERALAEAPTAQREVLERLLSGPPSTASTGLVLVTLDASSYLDAEKPEVAQSDDQIAFAATLRDVELANDALPFSIALLRGDDGSFLTEVAKLFGLAVLVVLLVLGGVLRARSGPALGRGGAVRRTVADVSLGLGVVLLANVWVRGAQVALGPDGLGLVGPPTPPTNIVSILLIALGVDYAIHLSSRYRDELGAGHEPAEATRIASRTVGTALLLGALTTAVGFLTNLTSPVPPIRDLGVLAAVGLVSAFILTTTFLPAVRLVLDQRAHAAGRLPVVEVASTEAQVLPRVALRLGRPALDRPVATVLVGLLVSGVAGIGLANLETEFDISAFLPRGSYNQRAYFVVSQEFAGGLGEQTTVLLTGEELETTAAHNAQVTALEELASSDAVVLGNGVPVGQSVGHVVRGALAAAAAPDADPSLVAAVDAAVAAGLRPDGRVEGDVADVYDALRPTGRLDAVLDLDPEPGRLPAAMFVVATQTTRTGPDVVLDDFGAAFAPAEAAGLQVVPTSELIINDRTIDALSASQVRGLLIALVVVLALLTVVYGVRLGRWEFGLLLMLPVTAVALWTLGLMALTGIPFDPITATVSALVIGVGIDFTIHLGERFVEDLHEPGSDARAALEASIRHTGSALAGSALTTALGFAVLTTGTITPFIRLGLTTIYAVTLSLFAVVAIQPAILLLWARRLPGAAQHVAET